MMGLTPRQRQLLDFIRAEVKAKGIAPSIREMQAALDFKSGSGITRLLEGLEDRGAIRRKFHRARAIELVKTKDDHAADCACDRCRQVRYIAQLKMVQGLQVFPPVAVLKARADNFRPLSDTTRAAILGGDCRGPAPRTRKAVIPREGLA
jgi:SOS-response transcriptional repressor LexA